MQEMNDLFNKLCDELCEYGEKDLTQDTLKTIDTLAHAAKNVLKVMEGCEGGGSYAYYDEDPRTTAMGGSMRGNSMRGSYRMSGKRDSMGRYSRGYSRHNGMAERLRDLMEDAPDDRTRQEIQRLVSKMEQM